MKNIAVFASGNGSDLQSLIDEQNSDYRIAIVIVSKEGIHAIDRAHNANIECCVFDKKKFDSMEEMDAEIVKLLREKEIDWIVFAGYLNITTSVLVNAFPHRIINIHPSLIPKHCGKGFYGMKVHQSVIDSKDKISGVTIHYVDEGTDTGEIIMQKTVPVLDDDTAETLSKRVLELEHVILPQAVKMLCKEDIK